MNFHNSADTYMRSVAKIGVRQPVRSLDHFDLSGWLVLWKPVGKILLVLFPFVLIVNMLLASAVTNTERSIMTVDNQRHEMVDKKIELLAQKARLWAPESIEKLAGEKLALFADSGDQVGWFDRNKGLFYYKK